jgi:peptide/nickel transport system substrate-binding protein
MTRRVLLGAAAGLAAAVPRTGRAAPVRGGKLTYARYADSLLLDPVFTDANVDIWVMNSIYDTLLLPTPDGAGIQPGLATKWEYSGEGQALALTLREGVKFSDGTALQASDVKWSLDRARNPKNGPWADMIASIDSVDIVDPTTVRLQLKHPDPTLLPALTMFNTGILPQALYEAASGTTDEEKSKTFADKPIGSGPFMLAEWQRGQRMLLKRNPFYWRDAADGRKLPYLDEIEFPIVPDDATRILKLQAGDVDGTEFVPFSRVKELQANPNLRMELWPSTNVIYLTMYVRPKLKSGQDNPLSNTKVRQALNYAVNKDAIIAITTQGLGKPLRSFMSSVTPMALNGPPLYPYDQAKAKALLADAGFGGGFALSCITIAGNQNNLNNLTAVQQMWSQIGVKLSIEQMDNATSMARYRAEDFQMRTGGWTDDIADPSEITSYFAYYPTVHCLHSGWEDERVNALFLQSQQENDPAKRRAQYREMQDIYIEAAPNVFLYETPYPVVFRKNVHGFVQIPLGNNYFDGAYVER